MIDAVFWEFFALTIAVEVPVYWLLLTRFGGIRSGAALTTAIGINLISHPLFVLVLVRAANTVLPATGAIVVAEGIVCVLEAGLIRWWLRVDGQLCVAAALLANGCSVLVGAAVVLV